MGEWGGGRELGQGGGCGQKVLSHNELYSSIALWPWTNYFSVPDHVQRFVSSACSAIKGGIRVTAATTAVNHVVLPVSCSHSVSRSPQEEHPLAFDHVPIPSALSREWERSSWFFPVLKWQTEPYFLPRHDQGDFSPMGSMFSW